MPRPDPINDVLLEAIGRRARDLPRARLPRSLSEWDKLAEAARQHRLEPALHNFAQSQNDPDAIPDALRRRWSEAFRTATVRSLRNQERLIRINAIIGDADIPYAALKGSWLAYHAYPHPALRPMRDLDILVPAGRELETFEALLAAGFERMPQYNTPLELAAAAHKHLPPIRCPVMDVVVEVHNCIFKPDSGLGQLPAELQTDRLLDRRVWYPIGDVQVPFLSSTDTLLHLILHSAFDHVFNNGPLVLGDVAYLLQRTNIDWATFWDRASAGGWTRGCALILHMAGRYHQLPAIPWPDGNALVPPDHVVTAALDLMFQNESFRTQIALAAEILAPRSVSGWFSLIRLRLVPPARVLAAHAGVPQSGRKIWLLYTSWLAAKLSERTKLIIMRASRNDAIRVRKIKAWQQGT